MNRSIKKKLSLIMALVIALAMFNVAPFVFGDDLVAINSTNFPDYNFRRIIDETYNTNHDDYLSASERTLENNEMDLSALVEEADWILDETCAISDITGIEFFTDLQILHCGGIGLDTLNTRALSNLVWLNCAGNNLTALDITRNSNLTYLNCSANNLVQLNLPYSDVLKTIYCYANFLTELSIDGVYNLEVLRCDQNDLTSLRFTNNAKLKYLNCSQNHLASLDLRNTSIVKATEKEIGDQTIDVVATYSNGMIVIPYEDKGLDSDNYKGSSLDLYDDMSGFEFDRFVAYDVSQIKDGITYECYPMHDNSENMTVTLNIIRDFYQVDFYTNSTYTERIGKSIVTSGDNAVAPEISQLPQCKVFDCWSDDITNVTDDMDVYIVWKDDHSYVPVAMADDKDLITVSCTHNDSSYQVSFISIVNSKEGDARFDENLDVVRDGYINAKDYDVLYATLG